MRWIVDGKSIPVVDAPLRINKSEFQLETLWTVLIEYSMGERGVGLIVLVHNALRRIDCNEFEVFSQFVKLLPLYMATTVYYQEFFLAQLPH